MGPQNKRHMIVGVTPSSCGHMVMVGYDLHKSYVSRASSSATRDG